MRLIVLFLVGIALSNVNLKYLLLEIDGDQTPEIEPEYDIFPLAKDDTVDEGAGGPSRDYKGNCTIIFKLLGQL